MSANQYGLDRNIPEQVKRIVRQRDGFGCVVCGKAIYEYDHFDPEFADAKSHNSDGIVLLCASCHSKKTRKFLSRETIAAACNNPKCKQQGFAFEEFDLGIDPPKIVLGQLTIQNCRTIIQIENEEIFAVRPPIASGLPFRISARLTDENGNETLKIIDNEWQSSTENWDVVTGGGRITIKNSDNKIILQLRSLPPNKLLVEHLDLFWKGAIVKCENNVATFSNIAGSMISVAGGLRVVGFNVAVSIRASQVLLGVGQPRQFLRPLVSALMRSVSAPAILVNSIR